MKEIKLTQGKVALVDDEDFEYLNQWKWCAANHKCNNLCYAIRGIGLPGRKTKTIRMTNIIMGEPPTGMVRDHIDGDGLNNQRNNLRFVTQRQNCQNRHYTKTSQYPGVSYDKKRGKWQTHINIDGKSKYLGYSINEEDAFKIYRQAVESMGDKVVEAI